MPRDRVSGSGSGRGEAQVTHMIAGSGRGENTAATGSAVLVCIDPSNPSERGAMWEGPFGERDGDAHHEHPLARAWALWASIKDDWPGMLPSVIANERAKNLAAAFRMESLGFDYDEALLEYEKEAGSDV